VTAGGAGSRGLFTDHCPWCIVRLELGAFKEQRLVATLGAGQPERDHALENARSNLSAVTYRRRGPYERFFKRPMDLVIASLLLLLLSPIMLVLAVLVRWRVGTPVIFTQWRIGLNDERFRIYKFRTMIPDRRVVNVDFVGEDRRMTHKSPDDPRVVPFGKALRRLSLDELPQLWNVVRGDMSLVGPRPEMAEIVDGYEEWQHSRHSVRPGVTCLWQISSREDLLKDSTQLDLRYIESISFATDLGILLKTPAAAIFHKTGY
jgi:lipopolysaccharide/colanic/teichoic acid biosynthesis glycosyltransferase